MRILWAVLTPLLGAWCLWQMFSYANHGNAWMALYMAFATLGYACLFVETLGKVVGSRGR